LPLPEVLIERLEYHQNDQNSRQDDDFAIEDESDDESIHASAVRRFSRRESKNAERTETAGILTTKERRASRSSALAPDTGDLRRRGSTATRQDGSGLNARRPSTAGSDRASSVGPVESDRPDVLVAPNAAAVTGIPYFNTDSALASRRFSRTSQNIHEERVQGISFRLPEPAFTRDTPAIKEVDTVPPTPAVESISEFHLEIQDEPDPRATGKFASWRGGVILVRSETFL
jgi:hypothetical protein